MAGAYKDRRQLERGRAAKWVAWWYDRDGKARRRAYGADKAKALAFAQKQEDNERAIRDGTADPAVDVRKVAANAGIGGHIADYRADLLARGDTPKHAAHAAGALERLFVSAGIGTLAEATPDKLRAALGRMRDAGKSARTVNHALGVAKSFLRWAADGNRLGEYPRGMGGLKPYPARSDRRRVRRALTMAEVEKLIEATEKAGPIVTRRAGRGGKVVAEMTGAERAMAYRVALATGFRAQEIATLTPGAFRLEGDSPCIVVHAAYSKRGKRSGRDDIQLIRRDVAARLRVFLEGRPPDAPVFPLPEKTARMLAADLKRAGIEYEAGGKVADFHALRAAFITHLIERGANPKDVQALARHSTISLTMDVYAQADEGRLRGVIEGNEGEGG